MQKKKTEVYQRILSQAREEFHTYGYDKTSIRHIAEKLNMSHGNIRVYFKTKALLYEEVTREASHFIGSALMDNLDYSKVQDQALLEYLEAEKYILQNMVFFKTIQKHRYDLDLLLFKGSASHHQEIRQQLTHDFSKTIEEFLCQLYRRNLTTTKEVTPLFTKTLALLYLNSLEVIVREDYTEKELIQYAKELTSFLSAGISSLIKS